MPNDEIARLSAELDAAKARLGRHSDRATDARRSISDNEERMTDFERAMMRHSRKLEEQLAAVRKQNAGQTSFMWWSRYVATPVAVALVAGAISLLERACVPPSTAKTHVTEESEKGGP